MRAHLTWSFIIHLTSLISPRPCAPPNRLEECPPVRMRNLHAATRVFCRMKDPRPSYGTHYQSQWTRHTESERPETEREKGKKGIYLAPLDSCIKPSTTAPILALLPHARTLVASSHFPLCCRCSFLVVRMSGRLDIWTSGHHRVDDTSLVRSARCLSFWPCWRRVATPRLICSIIWHSLVMFINHVGSSYTSKK